MSGKLMRFPAFIALVLLVVSASSPASDATGGKTNINRVKVSSGPETRIISTENPVLAQNPSPGSSRSRYDSPGLIIGQTTYDQQSIGRMNRQVGWRGNQTVHFVWTKQTNFMRYGDCGTAYEAWDAEEGQIVFNSAPNGGCDIHPRSGYGVEYSAYAGLDIDAESRAIISNHHDEGSGFSSTIWWDYEPAVCFFSPGRYRIPDSTYAYPDLAYPGVPEYIWPSHEFQVLDGDTVIHLFARQGNEAGLSGLAYFRFMGGYSLGFWEYPPVMIDTVDVFGHVVTASRVSPKVALVWIAKLPQVAGDGESECAGRYMENDVYYCISQDMGASWGWSWPYGDKFNITESDITKPGWRAETDLSCLIDTQDRLHVIWNAREYSPAEGGVYPHFYGSRLFHWDEYTNEIRTIRDANWDIPESGCDGGVWNKMSIVKPMISECDGKFYTLFVQFNDICDSVDDDCRATMYRSGAANGELYISISDNNGYNWGYPYNLTNSYTPDCEPDGGFECESDMWPSMSRFGMEVTDGNFTGVPILDPSWVYSGDYFLDVLYVNDKSPGGVIADTTTWTINPVKWFRVACIEPEPSPVLAALPTGIYTPTWTKPGVQLDTTIRLENIGNAPLYISTITPVELSGPPGWLDVSNYGPINIMEYGANFYDLTIYLNAGGSITTQPLTVEGYLQIWSNSVEPCYNTIPIRLLVADNVQLPDTADISTSCLRMVFNNGGNIGNGGSPPDGGYNMDFFDDCDITANSSGADDNVRVYLKEASPFVLRIGDMDDTLLNYYMCDADWMTDDGFRPLVPPLADIASRPDCQYGYTGKFVTQDSLVALEAEYFAPRNADSCEFIIKKMKVYNMSGSDIFGVYVGDIMDWNIPSDSGVENGSGSDESRRMMFCFGAEYGPDEISNNDCVLADQRYGGYTYYGGYRLPYEDIGDSFPNPKAMWTHMNAEWVKPTGGFVPGDLYLKAEQTDGYFPWESGNPEMEDSLYQDLHMVSVFGQYDLAVGDTLVFVSILAAEYDGGLPGLTETVDKARKWINRRGEEFTWLTTDFSAVPRNGRPPMPVMFSPIPEAADRYYWDFGDGDSLTFPNPIHTYTAQGIYDVRLAAQYDIPPETLFVNALKEDYVSVKELQAEFSAEPRAGYPPLTVQFTDESFGNPGLWFWDFGDGETSHDQSPSHVYEDEGIYDVQLTVQKEIFTDSLLKLGHVVVSSSFPDVRARITAGDAVPGFPLFLWCYWYNTGGLPAENCTLKVLPPPEMDFYGVNPIEINCGTYDGFLLSNDTIIIPLQTMLPHAWAGSLVQMNGRLKQPDTVNIGDILLAKAWISTVSPEADLGNNYYEHLITVTGSYDPNDKQADPEGIGETCTIAPGQRLTYTVLFENKPEATADATYIRIVDTLDPKLDWRTLSFDDMSHPDPCGYEFDPYAGVITWFCDSIMLPPNVNPPEGEGYVAFSISPKADLAPGTEISNTAWIRFDYNKWLQAPEEGPVVRTIGVAFVCGDADGNGTVNILDVTHLINYLYKNGPAPNPEESGDADGSGTINLLDVTHLINYLYKEGPEPIC